MEMPRMEPREVQEKSLALKKKVELQRLVFEQWRALEGNAEKTFADWVEEGLAQHFGDILDGNSELLADDRSMEERAAAMLAKIREKALH